MDPEEQKKDDFKWFGEGFDGFPKRLPDDCVEYAIYIIDQRLQEAALRARLKEIQDKATTLTKTLLKDYIWQRDTFKLDLVRGTNSNTRTSGKTPQERKPTKNDEGSPHLDHLHGRTDFGDSIADEWLIVYLLRELSKTFSDAWIRVFDTDGEFLLIEAAKVLPKWLNPDVAENRIWINGGELKIIPPEATPAHPISLPLADAITLLSTNAKAATAFPAIGEEAFHRLADYPAAISSTLHNALITIPRRAAYLLHANPAYISPATEAFYLRDPISSKCLETKDLATLSFPPEDFVTVSARFSRVGYAQLRSQEYPPPPAWTGVTPHVTERAWEVGMKVSCGLEMMVADPANVDRRAVREVKVLLEDVETGEVTLPSDTEIKGWEAQQDDEAWLDIDFKAFERELDGKKTEAESGGPAREKGKGFGDPAAQANLRKMVDRFESFLSDDKAGIDGARDFGEVDSNEDDDDDDDEEKSDEDDTSSVEGEDKNHSFDDAEFERAMKEMMGMPPDEVEKSGLLDDARRLALEMEDEEEAQRDDEEEVRQIMEMMERELKGHGVLDDHKEKKSEVGQESKAKSSRRKKRKPAEPVEELSSEDEDELGGVDVNLLRNMLASFKGQEGMVGPAGNMMKAMGINMPLDELQEKEDET